MQQRQEAGASTGAALVLLLVIAAGGAWNFHRNVALEAAVYRPFRTHTEAELAALSSALGAENDQVAALYGNVASQRATARDRSHYDQRIAELERVQRAGKAKKNVQAELAKSNTTLKLLADEERMRAAEAAPVMHFFKRLLTI